MQTFMPYPSFFDTAKVLDNKRLGKQITEARQILTALTVGSGWINHPIVSMWRGYEEELKHYINTMQYEWQFKRGFNYNDLMLRANPTWENVPVWFRDEVFRSHRANLVKKDPEYYIPHFGDLPWEPYIWWKPEKGFYHSINGKITTL
jgi:hypothetical protein